VVHQGRRRIGRARVTPHDLRHGAASLAVSAGANVKAVQRMLGHASAAMTLDVYADLFDDDLEAGPELWWLLRVARWAAGVPGASVGVPSGLLGVVCVAVASVAAVVAWRWRAVRIGAGLAAMCLLAWTLSGLSGGHDTIVR